MKKAYLITAYDQPLMLKRLVLALNAKEVFFIKGNFSAAELAHYGGVNAVDAQVLSVLKNQKPLSS